MRDAKQSPAPGSIALDGEHPLVIPVLSAAGGVGRSTVAALLAGALSHATSDHRDRAVAVCDTRPRAASPWPGWLDHTAECGIAWLASCAGDAARFGREVRRSTSAIDVAGGRPIWVLADTGPLLPAFSGADPGPRFWVPLLRYVRAAVIDSDSLEAFRLVRQQAGGALGVAAAWLSLPLARTSCVWVSDPSPVAMSRTLEAMTAAEACGLPMGQFVVAVNDCRGHGWAARSRSRRTLLADRVGAIVEIGHDSELHGRDRPSSAPERLGRRDVAALVNAVITAAASPAARPSLVPAPAERTPWHVAAPAYPVPANG